VCRVALWCLLPPLLQIGLVSQEPLLFSGSVMDNIMYGRPDATLAEVKF
jgi:ABC-type multidrug transport system fused ATPase/permease subunit